MDQCGKHIAAYHELKGQEARWTKFSEQAARRPHVHGPGLHPAFHPAGALAQPRAKARRRLFIGRRIDNGCAVAETREPHAEIGVLGNVVRIPGADLAQRGGAEMVGRASEWQREPQLCKAGRNRSNCAAYSAVNRRASQLSLVLSMVSAACTQPSLRPLA